MADLSLINNQLKEWTLITNNKWHVYELNVSENFITDEYLEAIGAFKVSPGHYQYGHDMNIKIYGE